MLVLCFWYLIVDLFVSTTTTRRRRYHTLQHTFTHPKGLLATQFAQITLVIMSRAAFQDIRSKGLVQPDAGFAGYSLGELFALASAADIMPNSSLIGIVFCRRLTMQHAVECDEQGRPNYAMCAVNPSCVGKTFDDAALREIVNTISNRECLLRTRFAIIISGSIP